MGPRHVLTLPLSQIDCQPQVREVREVGLAGLAQSLVAVGLQQPILVRPAGSRWVIVDGERRFRAAQRAGWDSIDALVDDEPVNAAGRVVRQLVANCQREGLTPIETARAISQFITQTECTAADAAGKLGFSAANVSKLLSLLTLPKEVQEFVHADRLAASTAYEIAKTKDPKRRAQLIARALKGALRRDAAARGNRGREGKAARPRVVIPVGNGRALAITGPDLRIGVLLEVIEAASAKLRSLDPALAGKDLQAALDAAVAEAAANGTKVRAGRVARPAPVAGAVGQS